VLPESRLATREPAYGNIEMDDLNANADVDILITHRQHDSEITARCDANNYVGMT